MGVAQMVGQRGTVNRGIHTLVPILYEVFEVLM